MVGATVVNVNQCLAVKRLMKAPGVVKIELHGRAPAKLRAVVLRVKVDIFVHHAVLSGLYHRSGLNSGFRSVLDFTNPAVALKAGARQRQSEKDAFAAVETSLPI